MEKEKFETGQEPERADNEITSKKRNFKLYAVLFLVLAIVISVAVIFINNRHKAESDISINENKTDNYTTDEDIEENKEENKYEYFSVLESTDNKCLRFNITLGEFIENYNQLVAEYANQYSIVDKAFVVGKDFIRQNDSRENMHGVPCDVYICYSTLFGYRRNSYAICVTVEKDSHCISEVSIATDSNFMDSFSKDQAVLNTIQYHIVYRALISELSSEDCYEITDGIKENTDSFNVPAYFKKGVAFYLDSSYEQSIGIRYARVCPCSVEQWENAPGFKNIPL